MHAEMLHPNASHLRFERASRSLIWLNIGRGLAARGFCRTRHKQFRTLLTKRERERERDREREYIPGTSGCAKLLLEVEATLFFAVWDLLFSKNNAVSWLGFCLLGNACQPDLFLRFLG